MAAGYIDISTGDRIDGGCYGLVLAVNGEVMTRRFLRSLREIVLARVIVICYNTARAVGVLLQMHNGYERSHLHDIGSDRYCKGLQINITGKEEV